MQEEIVFDERSICNTCKNRDNGKCELILEDFIIEAEKNGHYCTGCNGYEKDDTCI